MKKITIILFMLLFLSSCATVENPQINLIETTGAVTPKDKVLTEPVKKSLSDDLGSPHKAGLLRERVTDFWSAFIKEDYEKIYFIYDPFFQARTNKFAFMGKLGRLKYHSFEIKGIQVQGNVAKVQLGVVYSLPLMKIKDKEFSQSETFAEFEETWLYIYDNWYKEFFMHAAESGIAEY